MWNIGKIRRVIATPSRSDDQTKSDDLRKAAYQLRQMRLQWEQEKIKEAVKEEASANIK